MAARPDPLPPLLPVIPEYTPWLDKVLRETRADAAGSDATFAARHGQQSVPAPETPDPWNGLEDSRGAVADKKA